MLNVQIVSWTKNKDKGNDKTVYWILITIGILGAIVHSRL